MHLKAYEMRRDIEAVVHAHPPVITAFSVAGIDLTEAILPETIFILGEIKFAQYSIQNLIICMFILRGKVSSVYEKLF